MRTKTPTESGRFCPTKEQVLGVVGSRPVSLIGVAIRIVKMYLHRGDLTEESFRLVGQIDFDVRDTVWALCQEGKLEWTPRRYVKRVGQEE